MSGIATAVVASAAIGYAGSSKAARAQRDAASSANDTQREQFEQTRADQAPYRDIGYAALDQLRARMGLRVPNPTAIDMPGQSAPVPWTTNASFSPQQMLQEDPGYQFRLAEGEKGINRAAAAGSGLLSGATMKALARYNQDYATNEFGNSFNRLATLAGIGQAANNFTGTAGMNMANNVANNQIGAGNARAAGYVGAANAATGAIGQGVNAMQFNALMNRFPGTGSAPPIRPGFGGSGVGFTGSPNMLAPGLGTGIGN